MWPNWKELWPVSKSCLPISVSMAQLQVRKGTGSARSARGTVYDADIIVAGGGLAGKLAASVFGSAGYSVICCDPESLDPSRAHSDTRVTALLRPAQEILAQAGIWKDVSKVSLPMPTLRVIDRGGDVNSQEAVHDFRSSEVGEECFGWVIANISMHQILDRRLAALRRNVTLEGHRLSQVCSRCQDAVCRTASGRKLFARLLIAADGRSSFVRTQMGIRSIKSPNAGTALNFSIQHSSPHCGTATEIYRKGESVTLIPSPAEGGECQSSCSFGSSEMKRRKNCWAQAERHSAIECEHCWEADSVRSRQFRSGQHGRLPASLPQDWGREGRCLLVKPRTYFRRWERRDSIRPSPISQSSASQRLAMHRIPGRPRSLNVMPEHGKPM